MEKFPTNEGPKNKMTTDIKIDFADKQSAPPVRPKFAAGGGRVLGAGRLSKTDTITTAHPNDIEFGLVRPGASGGPPIDPPNIQMNTDNM